MDWTLAINRNRDQLRQIVLALFALARMRVGGSLFTLERDVFAAIMLVLRPAESAVRRLIVIAAHELEPLTSPRLRGEVPGCAGRRGDFPQHRPDRSWFAKPRRPGPCRSGAGSRAASKTGASSPVRDGWLVA